VLNIGVPLLNISAAFHNFSPDVFIYVDGIGLTSNYFNMVHPVLLFKIYAALIFNNGIPILSTFYIFWPVL
jgi:hypothetical protein